MSLLSHEEIERRGRTCRENTREGPCEIDRQNHYLVDESAHGPSFLSLLLHFLKEKRNEEDEREEGTGRTPIAREHILSRGRTECPRIKMPGD